MGKTKKHEKTWGRQSRPHYQEEYDRFWDDPERDDYTVQDFFENPSGMHMWCSNCGYVEPNEIVTTSKHQNHAVCPECGGPATISYE